jgi:hypothetical protein
VAKNTEAFEKFVRLKLTGEIVEVVGFDSGDIMITTGGKPLPWVRMRFPVFLLKKRQRWQKSALQV